MENLKDNIFKWLMYAAIGAVVMTLIIFFRDWIGEGINEYNFYATKLLKGFIVFCFISPVLDVAVNALFDRFGLNQQYEDCDDSDEIWFYQGYKNGMCVAEVVYKNPISRKEIEHKFTYVDSKGEFITNDMFDVATEFTPQGYGQVCKNGLYNMIDRTGRYMCDEWYIGMSNPDEDGCIKVMNNEHLTNFLDSTGKPMWSEWKKEM